MVLTYRHNLNHLFVLYSYYRAKGNADTKPIPSWTLAIFIPSKIAINGSDVSLLIYGQENYPMGNIRLQKKTVKEKSITTQIRNQRCVLIDSGAIGRESETVSSENDVLSSLFEIPLYPIGKTKKDSKEIRICPQHKSSNVLELHKALISDGDKEDTEDDDEEVGDTVQLFREIMASIAGLFDILPKIFYCGMCNEYCPKFYKIDVKGDKTAHICEGCDDSVNCNDLSLYIHQCQCFPSYMDDSLYDKLVRNIPTDHNFHSYQKLNFDQMMLLLMILIEHRIGTFNENDVKLVNQFSSLSTEEYDHVPSWLKLYSLISNFNLKLLFMDDAYQSIVGDMLILGNLVYDEKNKPAVKFDIWDNLVEISGESCVFESHLLSVIAYPDYRKCRDNIKAESESSAEEVMFKGITR